MSGFPFQVGDRVRLDNWVPDSFVVIKILGDEGFLYDSPASDKGECYITFEVRYKGQRRTWSRYEGPAAMSWEEIARQLHDALDSFVSYDGSGQGGAEDGNRGDWPSAYKAMRDYDAKAKA